MGSWREIMLLPVNDVQEKTSQSQDRRKFWKRASAICNLHLCYNFVLVLHENALILSQSEARNFFQVFQYMQYSVVWIYINMVVMPLCAFVKPFAMLLIVIIYISLYNG